MPNGPLSPFRPAVPAASTRTSELSPPEGTEGSEEPTQEEAPERLTESDPQLRAGDRHPDGARALGTKRRGLSTTLGGAVSDFRHALSAGGPRRTNPGLTPLPLNLPATPPTGKRPFHPETRLSVTSSDPGLRIIGEGPGTWHFAGTASGAGGVRLQLPGQVVDVALSAGMSQQQVLDAVLRALPGGYEAVLQGPPVGGLVASIGQRREEPTPVDFALEVNLANDPGQRVRFAGGDTLTVSGRATGGGIIPSMLQLTLEGNRIQLPVRAGSSAQETTRELIAALPKGFTAELRGEDPVTLRVRRA